MESRRKFVVWAVAHKTNNQEAVGGNILRATIKPEASEHVARYVDSTGVHLVVHTLCPLVLPSGYGVPLTKIDPNVHTFCKLWVSPGCTVCPSVAEVRSKCVLCAKEVDLFSESSAAFYTL